MSRLSLATLAVLICSGATTALSDDNSCSVVIENDRLVLKGVAEPIDADTIWIGIHKVRLYGIEALEQKQPCTKDGVKFPCGRQAKQKKVTRRWGEAMIATKSGNFGTHSGELLLATILASIMPYSARCEPLVLQCHFLDGTKGGGYAATVNQIVVDPEQEMLDFRAAETIGTANPQNYMFQTTGSDKLVLLKSPNGFSAGGVRYGTPFAINIDIKTGLIVWSYIDGEIPEHSRYQCTQ